jgi:long-chain fatty acid transport protein
MRTTILIALLLLAPAAALASGFEVINVNPRDLAMSASLVAAQQDAAATFQNPAALSKLEGLNFSLAGSILSIQTTWNGTPAVPGSQTSDFAPVPPVGLYASYGTKLDGRGFGVGFGMATPGGGQVHWASDWEGRGRIIMVERRVLSFHLNAAYEVMPWLRVGGGAIYYYGIQYLKQGIQPFPDAFGELSANGGGFSFQLAAEATPIENLTIGVDYKHKATMKTKGDGNFVVPPAAEGPTTQDTGVKEDLPFPNLLAVGVAYRFNKAWLATLQYNFSNWSVYEADSFIPDVPGQEPITVPRDYGDGHILRGGVEWTVNPTWTVRGGLMRDWSGYNSATLSPTLPDSNTTAFTAGASYNLKPDLGLHAALFYGLRDKTTATGTEAFPGSYDTDIWIASFGVTWRTDLGGAP